METEWTGNKNGWRKFKGMISVMIKKLEQDQAEAADRKQWDKEKGESSTKRVKSRKSLKPT